MLERDAWHELPDSILRLELRCFHIYLKKLADKEGLYSTSEQLYWLAQNSRNLILKKVSQTFSGAIHYKPGVAKQIIDASGYHKATRTQLRWLVDRTRYSFTYKQLEKGMGKNFDLKSRSVTNRLRQLGHLGINLVPLRNDFYLEQMPSLPMILELLEDDSTSFKLTSNGEIKW